jgi:hypothetical protein
VNNELVAAGLLPQLKKNSNANPDAEVWAYQIADLMGSVAVPVTVKGSVRLKLNDTYIDAVGSIQAFADHESLKPVFYNYHVDLRQNSYAYKLSHDFRIAFDFLLKNYDRGDPGYYNHNYFRTDRTEILLDHGLAFKGQGYFNPPHPNGAPFDESSAYLLQWTKKLTTESLGKIIDSRVAPGLVEEIVDRRNQLIDALEKKASNPYKGLFYNVTPNIPEH